MNKYLLVAKHKAKQFATPIYDKLFYIRAKQPIYHNIFWRNIEERLAAQQHTAIHVANVNMCNAKCVFCGQHKFERPKHVMTYQMFEEIIADAISLKTIKEIDFTPPLGEPLLDEGIFDKAALAGNHLYIKSITTNGILLSRHEICENVAIYFNEVRISIGGLDWESYKKAYNVNKFSDVFVGLINLLNIADKQHLGLFPKVKLLVRSPKSEWALIKSPYWNDLQLFIDKGILTVEFTNYYDNWGGSVKPEDLIGVMKARQPKKKCGIPCYSLGTFFIEHQGNVRLCGCRFINKENDGLVVGNINEQTLKEILAVDNLMPLYRKFIDPNFDKSPEVCQNCTLYRPMSL